jgi:hypothetical protein
LQRQLCSPSRRHQRAKSGAAFAEVLEMLRTFVMQGNEADTTRGLVCGIFWLHRKIAINTHQLAIITGKCKSSINGAFQALGYGTVPAGADVIGEIEAVFPFMKHQFGMLRQWTIRQRIDDAQGEEAAPEFGDPIFRDQFVASYLNEQCSLNEMVQQLIRSQERAPRTARAGPDGQAVAVC